MKLSRLALRPAPFLAAGLVAVTMLPSGLAAQRTSTGHAVPAVKLIATVKTVKAFKFGKFIFIDPGVYVATFGSPLEFDVRRASYAKPITITQVIQPPGSQPSFRHLPGWAANGWLGLRRFLRVAIKNAKGKTVADTVMPFCPDSFNPQRATPNSPAKSPFPFGCGGFFFGSASPFTRGMVWGVQRGWGADPFGNGFCCFGGQRFRLPLGTYTMTVKITLTWRLLLHIPARVAHVTVKLRVVKPGRCGPFGCAVPARFGQPAALPKLPQVPALANPPASILPDLIPLPSHGIIVRNQRATTRHPATSILSFGATVWIGGHSRLDVQGFRTGLSPVMKAFQYFWRDGRIVGRARAGTMGFVGKKGHQHWHFQQFAQYRLLNASKTAVLRSRKVGFCIAPTDAIDLLLPHAMWQPTFFGFGGGACGSPTALWVQEALPLGWGDTYFQFVNGQAFDITNLPNGTYYIEIIANPDRVLHESKYANDVSLRKVILGGTPGNRTVTVPAFHGIDPEH